MNTLGMTEAAKMLRLHPNTLQQRAKRGLIPGASKPGKEWVFIEDGLRAYLYSLSPCRSTASAKSGTSTSQPSGEGLEGVLGLPIKDRRRRITRD